MRNKSLPNKSGYYGSFGGRFAPETLMAVLFELENQYRAIKKDKSFKKEFEFYLKAYAGRPTNLYLAKRLSAHLKTLKVYLKREDLLHTGAHKINNTLGQILVARRMGKTRIIAETGAGQHGVATATAAALFGLKCVVYMGSEDVKRQSLNVYRMKLMGAQVIPVESGSKTLNTDSLANNPRLRRQRQVARLIRKGLDDLRQLATENKSDEFFAVLFRLLQEQLGERLDCPASSITEAVIDERLVRLGAPETTLAGLRESFLLCNQARYAPLRTSSELAAVIPRIENAARELQQVKA